MKEDVYVSEGGSRYGNQNSVVRNYNYLSADIFRFSISYDLNSFWWNSRSKMIEFLNRHNLECRLLLIWIVAGSFVGGLKNRYDSS